MVEAACAFPQDSRLGGPIRDHTLIGNSQGKSDSGIARRAERMSHQGLQEAGRSMALGRHTLLTCGGLLMYTVDELWWKREKIDKSARLEGAPGQWGGTPREEVLSASSRRYRSPVPAPHGGPPTRPHCAPHDLHHLDKQIG
jgi:hypothetical protein